MPVPNHVTKWFPPRVDRQRVVDEFTQDLADRTSALAAAVELEPLVKHAIDSLRSTFDAFRPEPERERFLSKIPEFSPLHASCMRSRQPPRRPNHLVAEPPPDGNTLDRFRLSETNYQRLDEKEKDVDPAAAIGNRSEDTVTVQSNQGLSEKRPGTQEVYRWVLAAQPDWSC